MQACETHHVGYAVVWPRISCCCYTAATVAGFYTPTIRRTEGQKIFPTVAWAFSVTMTIIAVILVVGLLTSVFTLLLYHAMSSTFLDV